MVLKKGTKCSIKVSALPMSRLNKILYEMSRKNYFSGKNQGKIREIQARNFTKDYLP